MESRYNDEVKLRKEAEEALARGKEEVEMMKRLLLERYKEEQDKSHLQAKALEQKHQEKLRRLRKEIEYVLAIEREKLERVKRQLETLKIKHELVKGLVESYNIAANAMQEERDNALKLVHEITTKHENMCLKAEEFESKYKSELILTKALIKEKQELEISYSTIDADAMQKERDNAIKLVHEITTTKKIESFICPISQEVMKDPQLTSDGYTYEAEAIKKWINKGHDTSPMTNLKLSHTNLVPNRALRSAIQELL